MKRLLSGFLHRTTTVLHQIETTLSKSDRHALIVSAESAYSYTVHSVYMLCQRYIESLSAKMQSSEACQCHTCEQECILTVDRLTPYHVMHFKNLRHHGNRGKMSQSPEAPVLCIHLSKHALQVSDIIVPEALDGRSGQVAAVLRRV